MSWLLEPVALWLVAARFSGFAVAAPALTAQPVPRRVRAAIVVWLTVFTAPLVEVPAGAPAALLWLLAAEFACGAAFGLVLRLVIAAVDVGGAIIDSEMGFLAANQFNPLLASSGGSFGSLWGTVALLLVWILDLVPIGLAALHESFRILPPGASSSVADVPALVRLAGGIFSGGLILAAPVLGLCFLVNVILGMTARAVQGLNVFTEGFNLRLVAGGAALLLFLPLLLLLLRTQLETFVPLATGWFGRLAAP